MTTGHFDYLQIEDVLYTPWIYESEDVENCQKFLTDYFTTDFQSNLIKDLYYYFHTKYPDNMGDIYYFRYCLEYLEPDYCLNSKVSSHES